LRDADADADHDVDDDEHPDADADRHVDADTVKGLFPATLAAPFGGRLRFRRHRKHG
jgi:hypothetical protein